MNLGTNGGLLWCFQQWAHWDSPTMFYTISQAPIQKL